MKQQPIVDRLKEIPGFVQVGGVLEYAALDRLPGALPAAFVVPQGEVAGDNRLATGVDQRVLWSFAVVVILSAAARRPEEISDKLEELTTAIKLAITGWKHPDGSGPITFAGAELVGAGANALSWAVRFRSPYHIRKV